MYRIGHTHKLYLPPVPILSPEDTASEASSSHPSLRDEYSSLLKKIEQLAEQKDAETRAFDKRLDEILDRKRALQMEISREARGIEE